MRSLFVLYIGYGGHLSLTMCNKYMKKGWTNVVNFTHQHKVPHHASYFKVLSMFLAFTMLHDDHHRMRVPNCCHIYKDNVGQVGKVGPQN